MPIAPDAPPASLFFELASRRPKWFNEAMENGYNQFCPIAKASEVLAQRWMPLILRELMADIRTFNDIHRGVPLISRAVLVARLRDLEHHGIIERRVRQNGPATNTG
jgi:DNA-binding HxlR family transcriptional regulator